MNDVVFHFSGMYLCVCAVMCIPSVRMYVLVHMCVYVYICMYVCMSVFVVCTCVCILCRAESTRGSKLKFSEM